MWSLPTSKTTEYLNFPARCRELRKYEACKTGQPNNYFYTLEFLNLNQLNMDGVEQCWYNCIRTLLHKNSLSNLKFNLLHEFLIKIQKVFAYQKANFLRFSKICQLSHFWLILRDLEQIKVLVPFLSFEFHK